MLAVLIIAQAVGAGDFSLNTLVQWGPLAIVIVLIILKKLAPGWVVERQEEEIKILREEKSDLVRQNNELRDKVESKVLPAIIESTRILAQIVEEDKK